MIDMPLTNQLPSTGIETEQMLVSSRTTQLGPAQCPEVS